MSDICEYAECITKYNKKGEEIFVTVCELLYGKKCHTNYKDKTWCSDWKNQQKKFRS